MTEKGWLSQTAEQGRFGLRARLLALLGRGGAGGALERRLDEFLAVKDSDIVAAAGALARRAGALGLPSLSTEERQQLNRPGAVPPALWTRLARQVRTQPLIEDRAGVTGDALLLLLEKEEELLGIAAALADLKRQVGDSRRLLQGVLFEASLQVLGGLMRSLADATPAERVALLVDAGLLLKAVDAQLRVIRDGQKAGRKAAAERDAALAEANEELLLVETLRALAAGEAVDEDTLRRAARRYAERGMPRFGEEA